MKLAAYVSPKGPAGGAIAANGIVELSAAPATCSIQF